MPACGGVTAPQTSVAVPPMPGVADEITGLFRLLTPAAAGPFAGRREVGDRAPAAERDHERDQRKTRNLQSFPEPHPCADPEKVSGNCACWQASWFEGRLRSWMVGAAILGEGTTAEPPAGTLTGLGPEAFDWTSSRFVALSQPAGSAATATRSSVTAIGIEFGFWSVSGRAIGAVPG